MESEHSSESPAMVRGQAPVGAAEAREEKVETIFGWPFVVAIFILVVGGWLGHGIVNDRNAEWIGLWGFRLTFWGLVVSIAGFAFTIWQLYRTRSSAIAASAAVQKLRRDFSSLDVILEISAAMAAAKDAQLNLTAGEWKSALSDYNRIRTSLDKTIAAQTGILPDELETLQDDQAHFLGACDALEEVVQGTGSPILVNVLTARLRRFESFSIQLDVKIRNRFGG